MRQRFIDFFKIILVVLFLSFVLEFIQRYHVYVKYADHTGILRTMTFYVFAVLLIALALAALSAAISVLIRSLGFTDIWLKTLVEGLGACFLGFIYIQGFLLLFLTGSTLSLKDMFLLFTISMALLTVIVVTIIFINPKYKESLRRLFLNMIDITWKPILFLCLCLTIWAGAGALNAGSAAKRGSGPAPSSCTPWPTGETCPNIILITFDALSATDMSLYGYHRDTTPRLAEFAEESFVFENMHANYSTTGPAVLSVLTSKYPLTHGVYGSSYSINDAAEENLATALGGYYTAAVSGVWQAHPFFLGLIDQFDDGRGKLSRLPESVFVLESVLRNVFHNRIPINELPFFSKIFPSGRGLRYDDHTGKDTFEQAERLMEGLGEKPFFLWVHVWPPREPYTPPPPYIYSFLPSDVKAPHHLNDIPIGEYELSRQGDVDNMRARYDEMILYADALFYSFMEKLKELALYDNSLIIVSSDHGEVFEEGWRGHASPGLLEPEIHIPLIIHLPGQSEGRRIPVRAEQVDLAPTIMDLVGKPVPSWMQGESLVPYMVKKSLATTKPKFSMQLLPIHNGGPSRKGTFAVYQDGYKMVWDLDAGTEKLFRLNKAGGAAGFENLAHKEPRTAARLKGYIMDIRANPKAFTSANRRNNP